MHWILVINTDRWIRWINNRVPFITLGYLSLTYSQFFITNHPTPPPTYELRTVQLPSKYIFCTYILSPYYILSASLGHMHRLLRYAEAHFTSTYSTRFIFSSPRMKTTIDIAPFKPYSVRFCNQEIYILLSINLYDNLIEEPFHIVLGIPCLYNSVFINQ